MSDMKLSRETVFERALRDSDKSVAQHREPFLDFVTFRDSLKMRKITGFWPIGEQESLERTNFERALRYLGFMHEFKSHGYSYTIVQRHIAARLT